jgi:hypothetical protein
MCQWCYDAICVRPFHRQEAIEYARQWRLRNEEHLKEYYLKSKKRISAYQKAYYQRNRERIDKRHAEYVKQRMLLKKTVGIISNQAA